MCSLSFDKEFFEGGKHLLPATSLVGESKDPKFQSSNLDLNRADWEKVQEMRYCDLPDETSVSVTVLKIPVAGENKSVTVYQICPAREHQSSSVSYPVIVHAHSGGFVLGSVKYLIKRLKYQAAQCGTQIFSVDYHLAPEFPYPQALIDCYTTVQWVQTHANELNIDPSRIAVMGESAGGNLATATAIMARDLGLQPPLAKQILIYPMLDDRTIQPNPQLERLAIWRHEENLAAWGAYLGDVNKVGSGTTDGYAAPARIKTVASLPSTYIEVGDLDLFRDEGIDYAARIARCNIDCELHLYPGVTHSFEAINPKAAVSVRAWANLKAAMMSF